MALSFAAMALAALPLWLRTRRCPVLHATVPFDRSLWLGVGIGIAAFVFSAIKALVQAQWRGEQPEPSNVAPIQAALASQPLLAMAMFVLRAVGRGTAASPCPAGADDRARLALAGGFPDHRPVRLAA
jgi:hypothetical protein